VPAVEPRHERQPGLLHRAAKLLELRGRQAGGLLDEHGLAGLKRAERKLGVRRVPGRDCDHVHVIGVKHVVDRLHALEFELSLRGVGGAAGRARDRLQLEARRAKAGDQRALGEAARADHTDARSGRRPWGGRCRSAAR
jgi:hypothetical protein